jgi:molecular chaperone Hsp33
VVAELPLRFACRCSRERVLGVLVALGRTEVEDLLATEGRVGVTCEFCGKQYTLGRAELEPLFAEQGK